MRNINVIELLDSPVLLAPDKGLHLLSEIEKQIKNLGKIKLDFSGYQFLSSTFLNHSFGKYCLNNELSKSKFFERIEIVGLSDDDLEEVEDVVYNAEMKWKLIRKGHNPDNFPSRFVSA
ncbi:MAG: STAS-like domain-containing protein [Bacteroidota bacterium]